MMRRSKWSRRTPFAASPVGFVTSALYHRPKSLVY
jgi:hypothetical protein